MCLIISDYAFSTEPCDREKELVDRLNNALKEKVTEYRRNRHREAKQNFLICLREQDARQESLEKYPTKTVFSNRQRIDRPQKAKRSKHFTVRISHYTGFTGEKLTAWNNYFIEAEECENNKTDMVLFVKCGEERKHYIKLFEDRWDSANKRLRITID